MAPIKTKKRENLALIFKDKKYLEMKVDFLEVRTPKGKVLTFEVENDTRSMIYLRGYQKEGREVFGYFYEEDYEKPVLLGNMSCTVSAIQLYDEKTDKELYFSESKCKELLEHTEIKNIRC